MSRRRRKGSPPVLLGGPNPSPGALSIDFQGCCSVFCGGWRGPIFQRERGATHAPVHTTAWRGVLGLPPTPAPEAAPWGWLLLPPGLTHLEGVEEVPEGPGVDDVVVHGQEEGHHHAGQAWEEAEGC